MIIIYSGIIISTLVILMVLIFLEQDRNFIIVHNFKNYYIKYFPQQIFIGFHNSLIRLISNKSIYSVNQYVKFDSYLWKHQSLLKKQFESYHQLNLPKYFAHQNSDLMNYDTSYWLLNFKFFNKIYDSNLEYFSVIKQLLAKNPNIVTCFFSVMEQAKYIPYHRGPYNGLLRYHFPIITTLKDENDSYLEVMGKKLYTKHSFLFDDTYPHRLIKNNSDLRVVLICDIDNPFLSWFKPHKFLPTSLFIP